jgi:hypothetical protein
MTQPLPPVRFHNPDRFVWGRGDLHDAGTEAEQTAIEQREAEQRAASANCASYRGFNSA